MLPHHHAEPERTPAFHGTRGAPANMAAGTLA